MRLISLGKLLGAGFLATVLAACGGSGSSTTSNTEPEMGPTINALGVDGPLLSAAVEVFGLQDYIDNGTAATSLLAAPAQSDAATGLIDDLELDINAGPGPFVLVVTADADTTDLNTGAAPVVGMVSTIITASEYARTPQPRFYATPLTSLVLSQAIANAATPTEADVEAALADAQADVRVLFGFGIDSGIDLLTTPPVIDESASGDLTLQADIAEYRAAIETLTTVLGSLTTNNPTDGDAILANIADDIEDGVYADIAADGVLAVLETVDNTTPGDVLALLTQEVIDLGLGVDLDGSVTLPPSYPTAPDSDQDGIPNDTDSNDTDVCLPSPFNANCTQDTDGDGDTDFTEGETADSDSDGTPNYQESSITDTDSDGLVDQDDPANADACDPSAFNAACTQDTDGDGDTDFTETETADSDSDGTPDYQESSITDADSDGVVDQDDPANADACDPSAFNAACTQDTDGDGDTDFTETETADSDSDGTPDYQESSVADADSDGLVDEADPANNDACAPSAFNAACTLDSDGDGETDFTETEAADADSDGTPDYLESSVADDDSDGLSNEVESSIADADSDGVNDQADSANNDACIPSAFNANCAQDSDSDGDTDFAETETADSDSDGTPDYLESSIVDTDSDGVFDEADAANSDACIPSPFNANCSQDSDGDGDSDFTETEAADSDSDGTPDYLESSILDADGDGVVDEDDPGNNDGCIPDAMSPACGADADGDLIDDANDTDDDNDSRLDGVDPDPLSSESIYHFDFFYNQLSSDSGNFKAATVGETVVQSDGTIAVGVSAATSTSLDLGTNMTGPSGDGVGSFNVRSDYQTTENALLFSGAGFAAGPGTASGTPAVVGTDTTTATDLNDPILSFTAESFDLASWGIYNFIGAGRVDLGTLGAPLGTLGEQAVSVLSFADGASDNADLNGSYGFVELNVTYSDTEASALASVASRVFDLAFDGLGGLTTGANSEFGAAMGLTDGTLTYDSTAVTATGYTVNATGAVDLALDATVNGFTDSEGNLITLTVDDSGRAYGAELGSGVTAGDLNGVTFDLNGLVVESSNARLTASNYVGATLAFDNSGGPLIATLSGTVNESEAVFDDADAVLPTVVAGTDALGSLASDAITVSGSGQFTATFAASDRPGLEIEGFLTANGGLLVRIIDTLETEVTGGSGPAMTGLQAGASTFIDQSEINGGVTPQVCDVVAQDVNGETVYVPVDAMGNPVTSSSECAKIPVPACDLDASGQPLPGAQYCPLLFVVTSSGQIASGYWTTTGGGTVTETAFTAAARGADQTFTAIPASDEVSVTQGVLFGVPQ